MIRRSYIIDMSAFAPGFQQQRLAGYQVRGISAESTIPNPALVALEDLLLLKFVILGYGPDLHGCIRGTGGQVPGERNHLISLNDC